MDECEHSLLLSVDVIHCANDVSLFTHTLIDSCPGKCRNASLASLQLMCLFTPSKVVVDSLPTTTRSKLPLCDPMSHNIIGFKS